MGLIFGEEVGPEVIILLMLIALMSWSACWQMVTMGLKCILRAIYQQVDNVKKSKKRVLKRRRRNIQDSKQATKYCDDADESAPFCYQCAKVRRIQLIQLPASPTETWQTNCCASCGSFVHDEEEWIMKLVDAVKNYKIKKKQLGQQFHVNPHFPIDDFVTKSELVIYVYKAGIAVLNIALVAYYFKHFMWNPHSKSDFVELNVRILTTVELAAQVAFMVRLAILSIHTTRLFPRRRPLRVFFGLFCVHFPMMALVNGIGSVRMWDLNSLASLIIGKNISRPCSSRLGKVLVIAAEALAFIPVVLCVILIPALAVLARVQQMQLCVSQDIGDWGPFEWILFLKFLLDIAVMVESPEVMQAFGYHLLGSQVLAASCEIFDHVPGTRNFASTIVVVFTSGAMECYEIFKETSALWRSGPNGVHLSDMFATRPGTHGPQRDAAATHCADDVPADDQCDAAEGPSAVGLPPDLRCPPGEPCAVPVAQSDQGGSNSTVPPTDALNKCTRAGQQCEPGCEAHNVPGSVQHLLSQGPFYSPPPRVVLSRTPSPG